MARMGRLARHDGRLVTTSRQLIAEGVRRGDIARRVSDGRWRRAGLAIVLHNGPLSATQRRCVARIHAGPSAVFTAFTAAELGGLSGWKRDDVHLLAAPGTRMRSGCPVPVVLHLRGPTPPRQSAGDVELLPDALLRAASTFGTARPGCGLLAAAVQQRVATATELADALTRASRTRHRRHLLAAVADIGGGSHALSEIDFVRLCRRFRLPPPERQGLRRERSGRRRYVDALWRRSDGRTVVAEVDGALHLVARQWWADQLRQNELTLSAAVVLRFPSVVVRTDPDVVAAQLRRALLLG